jgi:hypothetical protein
LLSGKSTVSVYFNGTKGNYSLGSRQALKQAMKFNSIHTAISFPFLLSFRRRFPNFNFTSLIPGGREERKKIPKDQSTPPG